MHHLIIKCLLWGLLLSTTTAQAAAIGEVKSLQMPAWVERGQSRIALKPGSPLYAGDTLFTGTHSRLLLKLAEGSQIKLGEQARFEIRTAQTENDGLFSGAMNLLKGAFRYTTAALAKPQRRDLTFGIGAVTVGIRGTDIWGKANPDNDVLVLLEGTVEVSRQHEQPVTMDQAMSHYQLEKDAPVAQATPVDPKQLSIWAQETELQTGLGITQAGGEYRLYLMSLGNPEHVQNVVQEFADQGYALSTEQKQLGEQSWTRLYIDQLASVADAQTLRQRIETEFGIQDSWIGEMKSQSR